MTEIGELALAVAFAISIYAIVVFALNLKKKVLGLEKSAENATHLITLLTTIASSALIYAFVTRDFGVEYVYSYSNRDLPMFYTVSAFWAGQKGSLLLWVWLLSLFTSIALFQNKEHNRKLIPYVMMVILTITTFFLFLLVFTSNPFERLANPPEDGHGLNPMLQNPGMIFHPPSLYLGYVGFTIPFAFAMAALWSGNLNDLWIRTTRRWTIFSWFFLSMGNLLGAQWAYVELGWGGYWAWDPVENASFMPWLVGTAYLHSVMIQEKKDQLKVWNMSLIIITFCLTIFGTFITRSGLIQSVHAFDEKTLGFLFLGFLFITLFVSFGMVYLRLPILRSTNRLDSFLSRESSFLFNNLLFMGMTFAVFWGTIFPMISEAVRGVKITVGPPFYNQVNVPIGLALLILMGICPMIAWNRASRQNLKLNFLKPTIISIIGGAILIPFIGGLENITSLLTFVFSIFVLTTMFIEIYKGTNARKEITNENGLKSFFTLIWKNKRRYGGYVIHIGVVFIFVGIAGTPYNQEKTATLSPGESISLKDYKVTFESIKAYSPNPTKQEVVASMGIEKNGKNVGTAKPEKNFYKNQKEPHSEVAIFSSLLEDLYIILAQYDSNSATFKVLINPLVQWIWIGGWVITFGTIIAMWPDKAEKRRVAVRYGLEEK